MSAWTPLFDGGIARQIEQRIDEVGEALKSETEPLPDATLASGTAGIAVALAYLAKVRSQSDFDIAARNNIDAAINSVSGTTMRPWLFTGFAGVAWAVTHLADSAAWNSDGDPSTDVDVALLDFVSRSPWSGHFDLIEGLVGIGVYAIERLPRRSAVECVTAVVWRLLELAKPSRGGVSWYTKADLLTPSMQQLSPHGCYDLGVSHGIPGAIGFLAAAYSANIERAKVLRTLELAVSWLLARERRTSSGLHFATRAPASRSRAFSRLAWCYGDLGIAGVLATAAEAVGEVAWKRTATRLAIQAAKCDVTQSGIVDCGLCHGAAGVGHVFNRLYQSTDAPELREAAQSWILRAVRSRQNNVDVAGYASWRPTPGRPNGSGTRVRDPGLLSGAAGIAAALAASVSEVPPDWDRVLLISQCGRTLPGAK